jgi:hypothetical protein
MRLLVLSCAVVYCGTKRLFAVQIARSSCLTNECACCFGNVRPREREARCLEAAHLGKILLQLTDKVIISAAV